MILRTPSHFGDVRPALDRAFLPRSLFGQSAFKPYLCRPPKKPFGPNFQKIWLITAQQKKMYVRQRSVANEINFMAKPRAMRSGNSEPAHLRRRRANCRML